MRFGERRDFGGGRRFGGSSFNRGFDQPKPIKVGEEYDVEIKETGSKGDGIARINNFVVFVNGAKLGEKVHIKITDVRDRFAIGEKSGGAAEAKTEETMTEVPEEKEVEKVADEEENEPEEGQGEGSEEEE
ncbi:MAG: TRAM domain-containing protein [Candidatus Aenigmatarchaeota archaeon]